MEQAGGSGTDYIGYEQDDKRRGVICFEAWVVRSGETVSNDTPMSCHGGKMDGEDSQGGNGGRELHGKMG